MALMSVTPNLLVIQAAMGLPMASPSICIVEPVSTNAERGDDGFRPSTGIKTYHGEEPDAREHSCVTKYDLEELGDIVHVAFVERGESRLSAEAHSARRLAAHGVTPT